MKSERKIFREQPLHFHVGVGTAICTLLMLMLLWAFLMTSNNRSGDILAENGSGRGNSEFGQGDGDSKNMGQSDAASPPDNAMGDNTSLAHTDQSNGQSSTQLGNDMSTSETEIPTETRSTADDDAVTPKNDFQISSLGGGAQNTRFFGVAAKGRKIAYVVDCSASMQGERFSEACEELITSIHNLSPRQSVYVCFFATGHFPMFYPSSAGDTFLRASSVNVQKIESWVKAFSEDGGTDPTQSVRNVLKMQPDTMFLLSDGDFNSDTVRVIDSLNRQRFGELQTTIHTIGFKTDGGDQVLKDIASRNDGDYRHVD